MLNGGWPKTVVSFGSVEPATRFRAETVAVLVDGEPVGRILTHGDVRTYQADSVAGHFPDRIGGTIRLYRFSLSESPEEYLTERLGGDEELVGNSFGAYGHCGNISVIMGEAARRKLAERSRPQRGTT